MTGEQDDAVHDVVEEVIGDIHAAVGGDVEPNLSEGRRQGIREGALC